MRRFQVVVTIWLDEENEFAAKDAVLETISSADDIEVNELVNRALITRIHKNAKEEIHQKLCSFGRRPGETQCPKKAIYEHHGFPYCMAHGYQVAGKKPNDLYKEEAA